MSNYRSPLALVWDQEHIALVIQRLTPYLQSLENTDLGTFTHDQFDTFLVHVVDAGRPGVAIDTDHGRVALCAARDAAGAFLNRYTTHDMSTMSPAVFYKLIDTILYAYEDTDTPF